MELSIDHVCDPKRPSVSMEMALQKLPPKLESIYEEILDDIVRDDVTNKEIALYTFAWTVGSSSFMSADFVARLVSVAIGFTSGCLKIRDIVTACKHLMLASKYGRFAASHLSALEFLKEVGSRSLRWDTKKDVFTISETEPCERFREARWNCVVAQMCLKWMEYSCNPMRKLLSRMH